MNIAAVQVQCVKEPLSAPFGFKGGHIHELWQTVVRLQEASGGSGVGLGVQSILWSDPDVFMKHGETAGNRMMSDMTEYALTLMQGIETDSPDSLLDWLLPAVHDYGKQRTGLPSLRLTFALNALVPIDHAAWLLLSRLRGWNRFDDLVPQPSRPALSYRHSRLASLPLISYGMEEHEMAALLNQGYFVLKIKLGLDPVGGANPEAMLDWDKQRLSVIHRIAGERSTPRTSNGRIAYYLDLNGRYDGKDRLLRLLEHADRIGALERIVLIEEPFGEERQIDVSDMPVRIAADESVHSAEDAMERITLGYRAIALKPIAKTLSMSFRIAKIAHDKGIPCFCADLTANPFMVDVNKNVAARLAPLPELGMSVLESNGPQHYRRWDAMKSYHPLGSAPWTETNGGLFTLDEHFYETSGGFFCRSDYYEALATATGGLRAEEEAVKEEGS